MSLWKVARDRGNQIARELHLRKSSQLVHPRNRRVFDNALADMARTPESPARARLEGLFQQVRRRRELQTAVALLDLAWRVPPRTRLEDDVVLMIRRCYLDAPQQSWRLRIRDELRDRQVHPFPVVRRVVHLVRQLDPVDAAEMDEIQDLVRGYPDLRRSIAERIILHNQVEHLEAVITYLSSALERAAIDPSESKAAKRIFLQLATSFKKSEAALEILYRMYLDNYTNQEPRGYLMLALGGYGDVIVPQLVHEHDVNRRYRPAIEHVLMRIAARGGVEATRALINIICDAQPPHVVQTCRLLRKALITLAGKAERTVGAAVVRETMAEALPALRRRPHPEIHDLVERFEALEWGEASVSALVKHVLSGTATDAHRQQIRRLSRPAAHRLIAVAQDQSRDATERRRALEALVPLRSAARPELAERLWGLFVSEELETVRVGVIHALSGLELDPGPRAREVLFDLLQSGSQKIAREIGAAWERIFPVADLSEGESHKRSGA